MSFKDDFVEALRSVKRDILGNNREEESAFEPSASVVDSEPEAFAAFVDSTPTPAPLPEETSPEDSFPEDVEIFANPEPVHTEAAVDSFEPVSPSFTSPAPSYDAAYSQPVYSQENDFEPQGDARQILDFEAGDIYDDEKTVISKNTILRGSLQTNDPIRLLGQVLGDIECRSNIVIAGKMQGNTVAANAQILSAQINGDLVCDDSVSVNDSAWILGNLRAQQADINGKIKGNLEIRRGISIGSASSIIGNISADELEIRRGAFVNGQIVMYSPSRDVIDRFNHFEGTQQ